MTPAGHRILFTALGFPAVVLGDVPKDKQALRATAIARLIESFCMSVVPEGFPATAAQDDTVRERMISVIAGIIKADSDCSPHELRAHGFSPDEIARHWPMASALARVSLNIEQEKDS